jgi:phosphate/sulfate permease
MASLREVPLSERWRIRSEIFHVDRLLAGQRQAGTGADLDDLERPRRRLRHAIEYVPTWVVVGVALCLGIGTTVGYERIVITVAEKIGKTHLTYAQGASAELVAMTTIALADLGGVPVSTTHVLSSGVAGTMWANDSGVQPATIRQIALAWILTLPSSMLIAAGFFLFGNLALGI